MAKERDASVARLAIAWLLHQEGVTSVIIGAKKMHQLEDNLRAIDVEFTAEELAKLDDRLRVDVCDRGSLRRASMYAAEPVPKSRAAEASPGNTEV